MRIRSPRHLQDFIDALRPNARRRRNAASPAKVTVARGSANCIEGALVAAAWLTLRGERPLLLDLKTTKHDVGHVVALFERAGCWGAISRSDHASLRYREPVYASPRELAMSYFHEYFNRYGRKTLRSYSEPFDVSTCTEDWACGDDEVWQLLDQLDQSPHHQILTPAQAKSLRTADHVEVRAGRLLQSRPEQS